MNALAWVTRYSMERSAGIIRAAEPGLIVGINGKPGGGQRLDIELPVDLSRGARRGAME